MGHPSEIADLLDSCKLRFNQCGYLNMKMIVQGGFMKIAGDKDKNVILVKNNVFETKDSVVFLSGQLTEDKMKINGLGRRIILWPKKDENELFLLFYNYYIDEG